MTDEELRVLVRDAIARHLGGQQPSPEAPHLSQAAPAAGTPAPAPLWRSHPSFAKFLVARGDEGDGACIIEPAVHCNHCGFCQSYGH